MIHIYIGNGLLSPSHHQHIFKSAMERMVPACATSFDYNDFYLCGTSFDGCLCYLLSFFLIFFEKKIPIRILYNHVAKMIFFIC